MRARKALVEFRRHSVRLSDSTNRMQERANTDIATALEWRRKKYWHLAMSADALDLGYAILPDRERLSTSMLSLQNEEERKERLAEQSKRDKLVKSRRQLSRIVLQEEEERDLLSD